MYGFHFERAVEKKDLKDIIKGAWKIFWKIDWRHEHMMNLINLGSEHRLFLAMSSTLISDESYSPTFLLPKTLIPIVDQFASIILWPTSTEGVWLL